MIDLAQVGAAPAAPTAAGVPVRFGLYLPGVTAEGGFAVLVRVIHQRDRFTAGVPPLDFPLAPVADDPNGLWAAEVVIPAQAGTSFGQSGTYLYRYQLLRNGAVVTNWFTDPFARATDDVGELSAFTTPDAAAPFAWHDDGWNTPELERLVVYELQVEEFNASFDGVVERLPYLQSLGVTCLELMPVTSLKLDFDWGYGPLHYFAPNARWGGVAGLKRLVDACHAADVAVILDVVYQHVDVTFPYHMVYADAGLSSPMIGGVGPFGPEIDYRQPFARAYVQTANAYWLREYHVDGFRFDEVTDLYDGPTGVAYAKMAYDAYQASLALPRFTPSGGAQAGEYSRIILVPEALNRPQEILQTTYSNGTWQDNLLAKARDMAARGYVDAAFAQLLDASASGYPLTKTVNDSVGAPVAMPVVPFQYLDSHDHSPLLAALSNPPDGAVFADRGRWYALQPFVIALYTGEGTPMLWQGQEFADNSLLPPSGDARIHYRRDVHWEYFYDTIGAPLIRLYRILGGLRLSCPALRSRESAYDSLSSQPANGVVVYRRFATPSGQAAVVILNFADQARALPVAFPTPGVYQEQIDGTASVRIDQAEGQVSITVSSHYGAVYVA